MLAVQLVLFEFKADLSQSWSEDGNPTFSVLNTYGWRELMSSTTGSRKFVNDSNTYIMALNGGFFEPPTFADGHCSELGGQLILCNFHTETHHEFPNFYMEPDHQSPPPPNFRGPTHKARGALREGCKRNAHAKILSPE
jgi:hypothetical protein